MPFVVGRKGSGKSAIAARLDLVVREKGDCCFIRFVPADFRHVEIRDLLSCLVNKTTSWQYLYRKVWEGIILGQIVRHFSECTRIHTQIHNKDKASPELAREIVRFEQECPFYVAALGDALSDVITKQVREVSRKTDALSQVDLRRKLEPYAWTPLIQAFEHQFALIHESPVAMFIVIDGLDEHWDTSAASLYFLAELLAVTKDFTAKFGSSVRFLVCLRDNIFRALVDTKSIEYDKLESLVTNLEWNGRSLFELIARRVAPTKSLESAVAELKALLPEAIDGVTIDEYLARHILQRPRDYVNFFRMLQKECGTAPRAGEGHIIDTVSRYRANRLVDLDNEFGFTYPGISRCIGDLQFLPEIFTKDELLEKLGALCLTPSFREEAPVLIANYGQPTVLARILLSIGVIGTYDPTLHTLRFVHEFSESRVNALWESSSKLGIHPVYRHGATRTPVAPGPRGEPHNAPAILMHPSDYLAEKDSLADLEKHDVIMQRKRDDLLAALAAIDKGQPHYRRFEEWVKDTISLCFIGDLLNAEEQVQTKEGSKRFEIIFNITGSHAPWPEIAQKHRTHRLLVECKNTEEPTDADFSKLDRDMQALDLYVAFLAYRGSSREPSGKVLERQRSVYINSNRCRMIITLSEAFLRQCLEKKTHDKCRSNLNKLWRDHVERWLPT